MDITLVMLLLLHRPLQENVYPVGPSVQFYRMFLEDSVKQRLAVYDALAVIEWDVVVAHDASFERLYYAAFSDDRPFWVKGSVLAGREFHQTAMMTDQQHILGHLNGNAICEWEACPCECHA